MAVVAGAVSAASAVLLGTAVGAAAGVVAVAYAVVSGRVPRWAPPARRMLAGVGIPIAAAGLWAAAVGAGAAVVLLFLGVAVLAVAALLALDAARTPTRC